VLTLLILLFAFYQWQHFMVFSPTHYREGELAKSCQSVSIYSVDAKELEGVIYSPQNATNTLLFFAGRSHDSVGVIARLIECYPQTQIITFNYRGNGKSEGNANEKNILRDGLKIAEVVQKNYGDFYLLGFSLGSSVAAFVASKMRVEGLFLVGAFDSIAALARTRFKFAKLLRFRFPTVEFVRDVAAPTYLFASTADETTYIQNARALKESVKNLAHYEEFEGLSHKEILWDRRVVAKIREVLE
jgi:pimeloyl-ACP methyl ester carboxylesterase